MLDTVASVWDGSAETFDAAFDVSEYDPIADLHLGELRFTFAPCLHYTTCYSIKIAGPEKTIVYSADTAPTERLSRFAHDADLFLCEAALLDASTDSKERGHMDTREAATAARRARVGALLLTHMPEENDQQAMIELAKTIYDGPVDVARPGLRYEL